MDLNSLYKELNAKEFDHAFNVVSIPEFTGAYLGISSSGWICLFSEPAAERSQGPSMRTSHVTLSIGSDYMVSQSGAPSRTERFDSLICESNDDLDKQTFISLVGGFLNSIHGRIVKRSDLTAFFLSVSNLFSTLPAKDLQAERQGLWGELFFMSRVRGFKFWLPFWHSEPSRKFDFSSDNKRVEVKTTTGSDRVHQFSHRQVYPYNGEEIVLASIMLRKEDSGMSLRELIDSAKAEINGDSQLIKLATAERLAKMENASEPGPCFDAKEAEESLALFWARDSPHFSLAEPAGVTQTHYHIDLSTAPTVPGPEFETWLSVWEKTLGRF